MNVAQTNTFGLGTTGNNRRIETTMSLEFVGVIDPINPKIETPQEVRDRVLEAFEFKPLEILGTTDDCGFSPFGDDLSTARETAFAKIRSRIEGTLLAADRLG